MGQNPAQKAAQAARGQQPKKRPGKAQREAIKRAQAARKKAGGAKPAVKKTAAKKAVLLPRGSLRAAYGGTCPACFKDYAKGEVITKVTEGWGVRTAEAVGGRAGVRPEQGPDRERRDVPGPEALGLAARSFALQYAPRPLSPACRCGVSHGQTGRTRGGQGTYRAPVMVGRQTTVKG
ncbi:hypothetical protein [Streptomyces bacillaris]|uniref:hypothetical protein n=1 Tax=Streptomyces bacillaris TaxID=68179 RepID=UPI00296E8CE1